MSSAAALVNKINAREAVIGICGLGYVGLPLVRAFNEKGFKVMGFDIDRKKIERLEAGISYIKHLDFAKLKAAVDEGRFVPTADFGRIGEPDVILIAVPTPLTETREPDLGPVKDTCENILTGLRKDQLVVLESTTYPGTTEEECKPILERHGLVAGRDFFLAYSPEREDPGNPKFHTSTIPKVVGGHDPDSLAIAKAVYESIIEQVVVVSSMGAAELTKILENTFRAVNIALVNELKQLCQRMGIDVWEVIDAAKTKPFGFMPFYPGPGLGGHCIPIDPFYLTWKAREYGMHTRFIELAGEINTAMPAYVVSKTADALNNVGKPLKGSRLLVLGIAYKKNVDDMRESPAVEVMELLVAKGAQIAYSDPFFAAFPPMREHAFDLRSLELSAQLLAGFDAVLLTTDHDAFDYALIEAHAPLLIDTRGRFSPGPKVVRA